MLPEKQFLNRKYVVVGSGLFGSVIAERIAKVLNQKVLVIEQRPHVGGNCHSFLEPETQIEIHTHGTHIFHTKNPRVWNYITGFSSFTNYQHKVLTQHGNRVYFMPISLATINSFYGLNLKPYEVEAFIRKESASANISEPRNLEEKAISMVGQPLYKAFIREYTTKQWGMDPKLLPADIITRLPVRMNYNANYFNDLYQGMPVDGYFKLFERLLSHPNISVELNCNYFSVRELIPKDCLVVYTGPIDQFFDYCHGMLEWRSLRFETEIKPVQDFQGTSVMNYADSEVPYTRIHEFKHLHPERDKPFSFPKTVLYKEYPTARLDLAQERYYPVNTAKNQALFLKYKDQSSHSNGIVMGGRLGDYRYLDMDQTIASALETFETKILPRKSA